MDDYLPVLMPPHARQHCGQGQTSPPLPPAHRQAMASHLPPSDPLAAGAPKYLEFKPGKKILFLAQHSPSILQRPLLAYKHLIYIVSNY